MPREATQLAAMACLGLALAGCGAREQLAVDRGGELATVGLPTLSAARAFLETVRATNAEANLELAVADRSCRWPEPKLPRDPRQTADPRQARAICSLDDVEREVRRLAAMPGAAKFVEPLGPVLLTGEELKPTLDLIGGLAAYLSAVDDVVSEAPDSSAAGLAQALADAQNIGGIGAGLTGDDERTLLAGAQVEAATGVAGFVGRMAQLRDQEARLAAVERDAGDVRASIGKLREGLGLWSTIALESDLDTLDSIFAHRDRQLRPMASDGDYRAFLRDWSALRTRHAQAGRGLPGELGRALDALGQAHASYINIIGNEALTPENRRALARIARAQLSQALATVADAIRAFL